MSEENGVEISRAEAKTKIYRIPVRQIVANTNPRNPLSEDLQKRGWTIFGLAPPPGSAHPTLWEMATSDNPEHRAAYVKLIQENDPEIAALASTILAQGQLQPVEVRDNGKKSGQSTYTLSFGCRRCLAILYNWCLIGKPKEPTVEARMCKENNVNMLQRAVIENIRKQPNFIEEAQAIKMAINNGQDKKEVASTYGVTVQTIENRLALLQLEPEVQKRIREGKLTPTKALEGKKESEPSQKPRMRSRKEIEQAITEFIPGTKTHQVLQWVLGNNEKLE